MQNPIDDNNQADFKCGKCEMYLVQPIKMKCKHRYCASCILGAKNCPTCHEALPVRKMLDTEHQEACFLHDPEMFNDQQMILFSTEKFVEDHKFSQVVGLELEYGCHCESAAGSMKRVTAFVRPKRPGDEMLLNMIQRVEFKYAGPINNEEQTVKVGHDTIKGATWLTNCQEARPDELNFTLERDRSLLINIKVIFAPVYDIKPLSLYCHSPVNPGCDRRVHEVEISNH